jgi:diketogulonate reductase-like aldo/keto reductase
MVWGNFMNPSSKVILNSGNTMPVIGLGTWQMNHNDVESISKALEMGYRMIDTSGDYGTQEAVGKAVRKSGLSRDKVYIVTKIEEDENAYKAARRNVEEMGLSYADLILIHRPPAYSAGENLWRGLMEAREEGIAKDIGVSNYSVDELDQLIKSSGYIPAVNQIEWSPFGHSMEMLEYAQDHEIVIQAYSPLTREKMTGSKVLREIASRYEKTAEQILLRWNIQLGTVPLPKAANTNHQRENLDIFDFQISEDDMATLNSLNEEYSSLSSLQYI